MVPVGEQVFCFVDEVVCEVGDLLDYPEGTKRGLLIIRQQRD